MKKGKELIKNTVILMVGKVFTQFLSFFLIPLYTHMLPVDGYGEVDLILTYISLLVPVVTIQQEMATFRFLIDARDDELMRNRIIITSFRAVVSRVLVFVVPYLLITIVFHWKYSGLVLVSGVATALSNFLLQVARGFGANVKYAVGSAIAGSITIIMNLVLILVFNCGVESILISMAIANICCGVFLLFSLGIAHCLRFSKPSKQLRRKMLEYSWPLVPNGISWWLINASDRTIVSFFINTAANGIYAIAMKFPSIVGSLLGIFTLSWTESASMHINDDDRDEFFSNVANNILRIFASIGIILIAILPFVFDVIIGHDYHSAYVYIPIAIVGVLLNCIVSVYSAVYVAKKMTKQVATTSVFSAIINIAVDLLLVKLIGIYAAVLSTVVAYLIMAVYRHLDVKKYVAIRYNCFDIIMALLGLLSASLFYYLGSSDVAFLTGLVLSFIFIAILNRKSIAILLRRRR